MDSKEGVFQGGDSLCVHGKTAAFRLAVLNKVDAGIGIPGPITDRLCRQQTTVNKFQEDKGRAGNFREAATGSFTLHQKGIDLQAFQGIGQNWSMTSALAVSLSVERRYPKPESPFLKFRINWTIEFSIWRSDSFLKMR